MKANEIMEIVNMVGNIVESANQQNKDSLADLTEKVTKEELVTNYKKSTNAKWMALDAAMALGTMFINKKRQQCFENIGENSETKADAQLAERAQKIETIKENLGIKEIEQKIEAQNEKIEEIHKMLSHLCKVSKNIYLDWKEEEEKFKIKNRK